VVHYENLKLYERLGLKITKIHQGIKFEESAWLKKYIDLNTELRTEAKNNFEKDFFKLTNNCVFGKTIGNIENRVDIKLVEDKEKARTLAAKPNYDHCTIFDEHGTHCLLTLDNATLYQLLNAISKPTYLLTLNWRHKRLCIRIGHYGAIQMLYYYYYYYYNI